jgi:hypothetical protein
VLTVVQGRKGGRHALVGRQVQATAVWFAFPPWYRIQRLWEQRRFTAAEPSGGSPRTKVNPTRRGQTVHSHCTGTDVIPKPAGSTIRLTARQKKEGESGLALLVVKRARAEPCVFPSFFAPPYPQDMWVAGSPCSIARTPVMVKFSASHLFGWCSVCCKQGRVSWFTPPSCACVRTYPGFGWQYGTPIGNRVAYGISKSRQSRVSLPSRCCYHHCCCSGGGGN